MTIRILKAQTINGVAYAADVIVVGLEKEVEARLIEGGGAQVVQFPETGVVSGQWRALPPGWAPRLLVRGGASGGTYTYRMRNRALVETADQSGSAAANTEVPVPIYPAEALEIRVTLTGTATAEVR